MKWRNIEYTDGTLSREIEESEEDEPTMSKEINRLNAKHAHIPRITNIRDRLTNIQDLITVCTEANLNSSHRDIKELVAHVLHFHVQEQLKLLDEELIECSK